MSPYRALTPLIPVFTLILALSTGSLRAESSIELNNNQAYYELGRRIHILEDKSGKLKIEDIASGRHASEFKLSKAAKPNYGFTHSAYWVRFQVRNRSESRTLYFLELAFPHVDRVVMYRRHNGLWNSTEVGDSLPFRKRELDNRNPVFRLSLPTGSHRTIYLRIKSENSMQIPLTLWSVQAFAEKVTSEHYGLGLYYGIFLVMAVYNFFIFVWVKERSYLFYVLYIASYAVFQLSLNGLAFQFIWGDFTWWANRAVPFGITFTFLWVFLFIMSFLQTKGNLPITHNFLRGIIAIECVMLGVSLFPGISIALLSRIVVLLHGIYIPFVLLPGFLRWRQGFRPARFYLLAWVGFMTGGLIYCLRVFKVVPSNFVTEYSMQIGSALEVMLLSLALADRINTMKKEKEQAQAELLAGKTRLLEAASRFVPMQFISMLGRESIADVELGDSIQKDMTILFADIRSFTTLSESMSPAENFEFLNGYLLRMEPIIRENNGFIDKFIGDAIMAIFPGGPNDAAACAIRMQLEMRSFNENRVNKGRESVRIGIGIHSGSLMLGTIGGKLRMDGTVISDAVNLASRMEGLSKVFQARIIISAESKSRISNDNYRYRQLGKVQVKGKNKPIDVFEIIDADAEEMLEHKLRVRRTFETALEKYQKAAFREACLHFTEVLQANPGDRAAKMYLHRSETYLKSGSPPNWNGVEVMDQK